MKEIVIDCGPMQNKKTMHKCLAESLNAPDYYGNNFDALSDVLSDIGGSERVMIVFKNMSDFLNDNKKLCAKLIRVLA